jgi:hypothetical protein
MLNEIIIDMLLDDISFECQACGEIHDKLKVFTNPETRERTGYCGKNGCYSSWFKVIFNKKK